MANRLVARANCTACFGAELCRFIPECMSPGLISRSIRPKDRYRSNALRHGYLHLGGDYTRST